MALQNARLFLTILGIAVLLAVGVGYTYHLQHNHHTKLQYLSRHTPTCVPSEFVNDFSNGALSMDSCSQ